MARRLDIESWKRRRHFEFFRRFDNPFFNICADVDVTGLLARCRGDRDLSFFAAALYGSQQAVNEIEEFRYRLDGEGVQIFDTVDCGTTVLMPNDTFAFAYFGWDPRFDRFVAAVAAEIERVRRGPPSLDPSGERENFIRYTVIPWVSFTSFSHASRRDPTDSVPRIVFGRYRESGGRQMMPVSVEVHHALIDGLHVGRYFENFQEYLDEAGVG